MKKLLLGFAGFFAISATMIGVAGAGDSRTQAVTFGVNVVKNGGAESNVGGTNAGYGPAPAGWSRSGPVEVIKYGASGGFPSFTSPGPPTRGRNFFSGGFTEPPSKIQQTASLLWAAPVIDRGKAAYDFSAYLGGYLSDGDNAKAELKFLSRTGVVLAKKQLGPVTSAQRGNNTGLWKRAAKGTVPKGTRSAKIQLTFTKDAGSYNDGYADNISLVLKRLP